MPATQPAIDTAPTTAEELARTIHSECARAIRRLDVLIRERDDVLLLDARAAVRHAAVMSARQHRMAAARPTY
jgi:hypothetical protein